MRWTKEKTGQIENREPCQKAKTTVLEIITKKKDQRKGFREIKI